MKLDETVDYKIEKLVSKFSFEKESILYVAGNTFNFGFNKDDVKNFCKNFLKYLKFLLIIVILGLIKPLFVFASIDNLIENMLWEKTFF